MNPKRHESAYPVEIVTSWIKNPENPEGDPIPSDAFVQFGLTKFELAALEFTKARIIAHPEKPPGGAAKLGILDACEFFDHLKKESNL